MTTEQSFADTVRAQSLAKCVECDRVFDLMNGTDAEEWYYGHDCE
jgi:hypothetical protein